MNSGTAGQTETSLTLRYLEPSQIQVFQTEDGRVRVTIAGGCSVLAPRFLRAHPLSDPDGYISIRAEPGDKEIGLLRHWKRLDRESRALVQAELDRRYLYATVRRILWMKDFLGVTVCMFETDRGRREVTLRDIRDNVVHVGAARLLLTDAEGNRYDIPDVGALDRASRDFLSQIL